MKKKLDQGETRRSLRVKKETLRGLGFAELDQVRGGDPPPDTLHCVKHPKPIATRYCIG